VKLIMKNIACSLAVLLLGMPSAAGADDNPTSSVPVEEIVNIPPASAQTAPPSEAPISVPYAPSTPSETKPPEPAPAPKAAVVEMAKPPVETAAPPRRQPSVFELPAIIVTDSKIAEPQDNVTQSVRVLYAEDIAERPENQRNLSELLRYEPGVFILPLSRNDANWGSYGGQGPKYNVHLLDGLPVDSFVDDMSLDPWAFERVDLIVALPRSCTRTTSIRTLRATSRR
jgi:outer membrane receptor protein involved in Fe transport